MKNSRTGEKLIYWHKKPETLFAWIIFGLQSVGRLSYQIPFRILKLPLFLINFLVNKIRPLTLVKTPKIDLVFLPKNTRLKLKFVWLVLTLIKNIIFTIVIPSSLFVIFIFSLYFYLVVLKDLPSPEKLITRVPAISTKIFDREARLLYTIYDGSQNRSLVKLKDMPDYVIKATIAIEDKNFYSHTGFSITGIIRAILRNISHTSSEGGSTITQQLIKNALLTPEKTLERKVKEIILSIETELFFSKEEILQMYFNEIPYGGTAYGIEEAAQTYFGKSIKDVNLAEAALLAGLPAAPTKYSPWGSEPQQSLIRQHQVLDQMVEEKFINLDTAQKAKQEKIILAPKTNNLKAPHFVMYVKDILVEKFGQRQVEQGGLQVTTSLDLFINEMVQDYINEEVQKLAPLKVGNGAALVTKPQTGEILGMIGSTDYYNFAKEGNVNVTLSQRQPGSAIKIITYALALQNGYSPSTIIPDSPITYHSPGFPSYSPVNYDNRFHGNVTLRTALGSSYNVPAVKTLASLGVQKMIDLGKSMGITTWNHPELYGLSITLGGAEVKMTDLAVAYGTLANYGQKVALNPILKVTDSRGKILFEAENHQTPVLTPQTAFLLTDILADNRARTPAFGPNSLLNIPGHQVAVKTGTTNDKKDNWTIGYNPNFLVAVWVGNNDSSPMSAVASGITGASPIWQKIMINLLKDKPASQFVKPDNLIKLSICSINGLLPCEGCPNKEEYFLPGTEPKYHCNSEEIKKILEAQEKAKQDKILEGISTQAR